MAYRRQCHNSKRMIQSGTLGWPEPFSRTWSPEQGRARLLLTFAFWKFPPARAHPSATISRFRIRAKTTDRPTIIWSYTAPNGLPRWPQCCAGSVATKTKSLACNNKTGHRRSDNPSTPPELRLAAKSAASINDEPQRRISLAFAFLVCCPLRCGGLGIPFTLTHRGFREGILTNDQDLAGTVDARYIFHRNLSGVVHLRSADGETCCIASHE